MSEQIGSLIVSLQADIARFDADMRKAQSIAQTSLRSIETAATGAFGKMEAAAAVATRGFAALAALASGNALTNFVGGLVKTAAAFDDLAEKTGATVEELSRFDRVARATGSASLDQIEGGLTRLVKTLSGVEEESKGAGAAFAAIGLDIEKLKAMNPAQALEAVAKALDGFADGAGKTSFALLALGKNGAALLPFLKELAQNQEIAGKYSTELAARAEQVEKQFRQLSIASDDLKVAILDKVLPPLLQLARVLLALREVNMGDIASMVGVNVFGDAAQKIDALNAKLKGLREEREKATKFAEGNQAQEAWAKRELETIDLAIARVQRLLNYYGTLEQARRSDIVNNPDFNARDRQMLGLPPLPNASIRPDLPIFGTGGSGGRDPALEALIRRSEEIARLAAEADKELDEIAKRQAEIYTERARLIEQAAKEIEASARKEIEFLNELARLHEEVDRESTERARQRGAESDAQAKINALTEARERQLRADEDSLALLETRLSVIGMEQTAAERILVTKRYDLQIAEALYQKDEARAAALRREKDLQLDILDATKRTNDEKKIQEQIDRNIEAAIREQQRAAEELNRTITDALMRAFESGKDFAKSFRDTVVNLFKTLVLRPTIQAIVAGGAGMLGLSGPAAASGGGGFGLGDMLSFGSSAMGLGGTSLLGTAGIGGLLSGSGGIFGAGAIGNSFALSGAGQALGLSAVGLDALAGTAGLTGLGVALGAAIPVVGAILAVLAMSGAFSSKGGPKVGGFAQTGGMNLAPFFDSTQSNKDLQTLVSGTSLSYGNLVRAFGGTAGQFDFALGFDTDPEGTAANRISAGASVNGISVMRARIAEEIGRDQARLEEEIAKSVADALKGALLASDIPEAVKALLAEFEGTAAEVEAYAIKLAGVNALLGTTNVGLRQITEGMSLADLEHLTDAFGGTGNAVAALTAYMDRFYSSSEKLAITGETLVGEFDALGVAMPQTRLQFRQMVESLDLTSESGRTLYAALIKLSPAFADFIDSVEAAAQTLHDNLMRLSELQGTSAIPVLQARMFRQVGQFAEGRDWAQQTIEAGGGPYALANLLGRIAPADFAQYSPEDQTQILGIIETRQRIEQLASSAQEAAPAIQSLAEAVAEADNSAAIAEQAARLRIRILELEGKTIEALAATRELELAAADSSLHPLYRRIYALEDEASAAEAAAAAAERAAELMRARSGLEAQILRLQGDELGALAIERRLELAALDESLRPLQERIYALQDEAAAAERAKAAADALARAWADRVAAAQELVADAADELRNAYQREAGALQATADRFRALGKSLREFRDDVSAEALTPRAGYEQALRRLMTAPIEDIADAGRTFLEAAQRNAATATDYRRDVARVMGVAEAGADVADEQVSAAEQQISLMQQQLDALGLLNDNTKSFADALKSYLGIKDLPQKLIDAQQAEAQAQASLEDQRLRNTAEYFLSLSTQWADAAASAFFRGQYDSLIAAHPSLAISTRAAGGMAQGWTLVGEEGPELVDFRSPAMVHSASQTRRILNNADVAALVEQLITEVRAGNAAIARNTRKTAKVLERFDYDGLPAERTV